MKRLFLILSSVILLGNSSVWADTAKPTVISESGPIISKSNKLQRLVSYVDLKRDYKDAPMTLVLSNGSDKAPGFKWFKVMLANRVIATEKNFSDNVAKIDMTGILLPGSTQLVLEGAGWAGARFSWKLVTSIQPVTLTSANPDEVVVGEPTTLSGSNFSTSPTENIVAFNKKTARVTGATSGELKVVVPTDADAGENKVNVTVGTVKSKDIKVKVRKVPELSSTSLQGVAPGEYISIFGKNFSKDASEVKVFFGDTQAQIIEADEDRVLVAAPFPAYGAGHVPSPVSVQIGKVKSKNTLPVQIGPQMFQDPGFRGGSDTPVLPAGF
jgi:hypothetical protein